MPPPISKSKTNHLQNKTQEDRSRFEILAVKNSIAKTLQDNPIPTVDFSESTYINHASFSQTPDRRPDTSKNTSTRNNSTFFSAKDNTPCSINSRNISNITPNPVPPESLNSTSNVPPPPKSTDLTPNATSTRIIPSSSSNNAPTHSSTPITFTAQSKITMKIPVYEGLGIARRPMMPPTELKNHKCPRKYKSKLDNAVDKLYAYYEDLGNEFLEEVLERLKDKLLFEQAESKLKMSRMKLEREKFEKNQEREKAKLKSVKQEISVLARENALLEKHKKKAAKADKAQQVSKIIYKSSFHGVAGTF